MAECKDDRDPCDILPVAGEAWSVCLPFGGRIWADGNGVHANGGIAPPDGVYGKVVIANGCLVGVEPEDVPLYTGSPCAPQPVDCGGSGNIGGGFLPGETTIICEIEAGAGVTVTGNGTDADPYVISASTGIYLRSDNNAIAVTGSGTQGSPFTLKHKTGLATTVSGMTFDAYGHLTSVNTSSAAKGIQGIVPSFGIKADVNNQGIATLSLQPQASNVAGDYPIGAYDVTLDKAGRVSSIQRTINITGAPVTAACGTIDLGINAFGQITAVADTMKLGAGYLLTWVGSTAAKLTGQFTMRCNSALAGIYFSSLTTSKPTAITIDGQPCTIIGNLFWGGGIFMAGSHTLEITGSSGDAAALLVAVS